MSSYLAVGLLALATSARSAEPLSTAESGSVLADLPEPDIQLERIPPRHSWDLGVGFSYGAVDHWASYFDAWIGFGLRGAWGKHRGNTRYGVDLHATVEGPLGVHTSIGLEPHLSVDHITDSRLLLGFGIGPGLFYHTQVAENLARQGERTFGLQPSIVGRIGWSQGWTRVGRRIFVYLEPKLRPGFREDGQGVRRFAPNPVVALVVGSGKGR